MEHQPQSVIGRGADGVQVDYEECKVCHEEWPCQSSLIDKIAAQRALLKETAEALRHYHLEWMDQAHENPEGAPLLCMHSQMAEDRAMTALTKLRAAGVLED